ncbi:MAG TPA: TlpA disulfide reductase family protein [Bryobacteraceae bacterium]|jgi:cytochrome c biogenesis protein CcmG/thiol:disulfide interchange protein DsbE
MDDKQDAGRWVEDRLAARIPGDSWEPDAVHALAVLQARRVMRNREGRSLLVAAVAMAGVCLPLMALPATRVFAQHCVSACVTQSDRFRDFFLGRAAESAQAPRLVFVKAAERKVAPDFVLNDAAGAPVRLSDFRGKVVLLSFWATWCTPCQTETPWFVDFQQSYRDRGLVVLGVSLDDGGWNPVKAYIEKTKINYRVMIGNDDIARLYGGLKSIPMAFVIDRAGRVATTHAGICPRGEYEDAVKAILAE